MIINRKSEALVETPRAPRYLKQLCKHFAHEADEHLIHVRVEYDDHHRSAYFRWVGTCTMQAQPEGLQLRAAAGDPIRLRVIQRLITSHLELFGRRDGLHVHWRRA